MYSDKNFGENEMNDLFKKFNQKNQKEDDEDKNFIISNIHNENSIDNNSISSYKQQIESLKNQLKLFNEMLKERDDKIKKLEKEIRHLKKENKQFKEQSNKYGDNNEITNIKPKIKNKTEIYNRFETINIEQNINNNYFLNNGQQNYKYNEYNNMINNFNENNYFINVNQNMRNDYSFKILSESDDLTKKIYEEDSEPVTFNLLLKNNGSLPWPKGKTKLVFEEAIFDKENSKDVILEAQEQDDEKSYLILFQKLDEYQVGEYTSKLRFNINGENIGEEIVLKIIIEESYDIPNLKKEVGENINELKIFEDEINGRYAN